MAIGDRTKTTPTPAAWPEVSRHRHAVWAGKAANGAFGLLVRAHGSDPQTGEITHEAIGLVQLSGRRPARRRRVPGAAGVDSPPPADDLDGVVDRVELRRAAASGVRPRPHLRHRLAAGGAADPDGGGGSGLPRRRRGSAAPVGDAALGPDRADGPPGTGAVRDPGRPAPRDRRRDAATTADRAAARPSADRPPAGGGPGPGQQHLAHARQRVDDHGQPLHLRQGVRGRLAGVHLRPHRGPGGDGHSTAVALGHGQRRRVLLADHRSDPAGDHSCGAPGRGGPFARRAGSRSLGGGGRRSGAAGAGRGTPAALGLPRAAASGVRA